MCANTMQNRSFTDLNICKWLFIRKVGSWDGCGAGLLRAFFVCFASRGSPYKGVLGVLAFCLGVCYFVFGNRCTRRIVVLKE